MLASMKLAREAVSELFKRITANEMLGNFDAHVKNFGMMHRDGRTPELSPVYEEVACACHVAGRGHALKFSDAEERHQRHQRYQPISPLKLRAFCNVSGFFRAWPSRR